MHNPIIVDLGFGDGGKGTIVDYLSMPGSLVVRYNGGPQAAHNVVTANGRHHTFAQFGSGTFVGAATHLSRFMLVNPIDMLTEERHLDYLGVRNAFGRTTVAPGAVIVTPFHVAANRIKEIARGGARHGSCGQGVGEARAYQLRDDVYELVADDLLSESSMRLLLNEIRQNMIAEVEDLFEWQVADSPVGQREWHILNQTNLDPIVEQYSKWARLVEQRPDEWIAEKDGNLIFEGAQGVLLDEDHGFAPHNTWTCTTTANAYTLCREAGIRADALGVTRTYTTRHGAGPFPTEQDPGQFPVEAHNGTGQFQGSWRVGYLDLPLLRYAIDCCEDGQIDALAVTHVDRVPDLGWHVCEQYRLDGQHVAEVMPEMIDQYSPVYSFWGDAPASYARHISEELGVDLAITSHGPSATEKERYALV